MAHIFLRARWPLLALSCISYLLIVWIVTLPSKPVIQLDILFIFEQNSWTQSDVVEANNFSIVSINEQNYSSDRNHRIVYTKQILYQPFLLPLPKFIKREHANWFLNYDFSKNYRRPFNCSELINNSDKDNLEDLCNYRKTHSYLNNGQALLFTNEPYLSGEVSSIPNAFIRHNADCGWTTDHESTLNETTVDQMAGVDKQKHAGQLIVLSVPDGGSFQHFVDGVLPKIAQLFLLESSDYPVKMESSKFFLLKNRNFPIVKSLQDKLLGEDVGRRIISRDVNNAVEGANTLTLACKAPPLHPTLWRLGSQLLGVTANKPDNRRPLVLYVGRSVNTHNLGRRLVNEDVVVSQLKLISTQMGFDFDQYNHANFGNHLDDLLKYWSRVRLLVGPHGGALTNVILMPQRRPEGDPFFMNSSTADQMTRQTDRPSRQRPAYLPHTTVVELLPVDRTTGRPPLHHSGMMFYLQSVMVGHHYWLVPCPPVGSFADMEAPMPALVQLVRHILSGFVR